MIVAYAEGRPHHCGQMARLLRADHRAGVVSLGFDPHRELRAVFEASSFTRALSLDGRLAALGGIIGPALATEGHVWLALATWTAAHPRVLLTEARRQIASLAGTRHALATTILDRDEPARRFAGHLGFVRQDCGPVLPGLIPMRLDLRSPAP